MVQLCSCPVEYRHEIVTDAFDARFCNAADIFTVIGDILVSRWLSQLDVLVNRNALDYLEGQPGVLSFLFQLRDALPAPYFSDRDVVHSRHDGMHARNLSDLLKRYLVIVSIPSE